MKSYELMKTSHLLTMLRNAQKMQIEWIKRPLYLGSIRSRFNIPVSLHFSSVVSKKRLKHMKNMTVAVRFV